MLLHEGLYSKEGPVVMECAASQRNVAMPSESCEEWLAVPGGSFVPLDVY